VRNLFKGFQKGDVCTGTIHRFNLQSTPLAEAGVISLKAVDPVYSERGQLQVQGYTEWVFNGFR
jgi:hypothetical protein